METSADGNPARQRLLNSPHTTVSNNTTEPKGIVVCETEDALLTDVCRDNGVGTASTLSSLDEEPEVSDQTQRALKLINDGHFEDAYEFICKYPAISCQVSCDTRTFIEAMLSGAIKFTEYLLKTHSAPENAIFLAARGCSPEMLNLLIHRGDPRRKNRFGQSALHVAADCDNVEGVKFLLSTGLSPYEKDKRGRIPLNGAGPQATKVLCEWCGTEGIESTDSNENTPIFNILGDPFDGVGDTTDPWGVAPPIRTTQEALETAKVLVSHGANVNAENKDRESPVDYIKLFIPEFEDNLIGRPHPDSTTALIDPIVKYLEERQAQ